MPAILPTKEAVLSLMKLAELSPEAAQYLEKKFIQLLDKEKQALPELRAAVREYVINVEAQAQIAANYWRGEPVLSLEANRELQQIQPQTPEAGVETPAPVQIAIDVSIAVDENSRLDRHYAFGGEPLNDDARAHLDAYFKAWMAENDIVRQNSMMYKAAEDEGATLQKVPPDELKAAIEDPDAGLQSFMNANSQGYFHVNSIVVATPATEHQPSETSSAPPGG